VRRNAATLADVTEQLPQRFRASLRRYPILGDGEAWKESIDETATNYSGDELIDGALWPLTKQAVGRLYRDLESLLNANPRTVFDSDVNLALLLALMICGRGTCDGGVKVVAPGWEFGDGHDGLENLTVEPGAMHSDFVIDFLVTYRETGPHPARQAGDEDAPRSLTIERRAALVRDQSPEVEYGERKLRRVALSGLQLPVVSYVDADIERDPFALPWRVIGDLARATDDALYQP
jgi:hypothetical protein